MSLALKIAANFARGQFVQTRPRQPALFCGSAPLVSCGLRRGVLKRLRGLIHMPVWAHFFEPEMMSVSAFVLLARRAI